MRVIILALILSGCGGSSSAGAGSSDRSPLTPTDLQAVELAGGFGGTWLKHTQDIIRLDVPPPNGAKWARAWQSTCRQSFTIYETTRGKSAQWLAGLFVHEGQHHWDNCEIGEKWEKRAKTAEHCFKNGIQRDRCKL